jgi:hypothetical protein
MVKHIKENLKDLASVDNYLEPYWFRIYDMFTVMSQQPPGTVIKPSGRVDAHELVSRVKTNTQKSGIGLLVLSLTPYSGRLIMEELLKGGMLETMPAGYGSLPTENRTGASCVILAPSPGSVPLINYREIYVFDRELPLLAGMPGMEKVAGRLHMVEGALNHVDISKGMCLDREDFARMYKWFRERAGLNNLWPGPQALLQEMSKNREDAPEGFALMLGLKIFSELHFIEYTDFNQFLKLKVVSNPQRNALENSATYVTYRQWLAGTGFDRKS